MSKTKKILCALCSIIPCSALAKSGSVNYSWGADALATMHDYVVTMMFYVPKVLYKAECWRTKPKTFHNKINCFSMIYEQNEIYNLS
ncbi:hypothetical protein [Bacteroides fragilis]|uniref:hypothetical protein n=1 Tax=Bacteroides fragilis TaxID=817 RepID=UPI003F2287CC